MDDKEDIKTDQPAPKWFIDLDWYQQNSRSFLTSAQRCLCPKCRERLKIKEGKTKVTSLLSAFKKCCSKTPEFVTYKLPILESIFRYYLANGNQPLELEELGRQLSERRSGDSYGTSVEMLTRLLRNDQYYGLRQAPEPGRQTDSQP